MSYGGNGVTPLARVPELCCRNPSALKEECAFCGKADDIILLKRVELLKHLVVIIASVENKGGLAQKGSSPPRSMAAKVMSWIEVKDFSFEE